MVAGASLLTDYILTVAVSIAGGVLAIQSAFGFDSRWRVPLCLILIAVMTIANLRGLKESGAVFAPPTYLYILMLLLLIGVGFYRIFVQHVGPIPLESLSPDAQALAQGTQALSVLLLLRAFSSGAVALSGVEAVSNGVPAFRRPESRTRRRRSPSWAASSAPASSACRPGLPPAAATAARTTRPGSPSWPSTSTAARESCSG